MMFKSKLATFVGALVLASATFAAHVEPETCPSIGAIQAEGLTMSAEIMENLYLSYNLSNYGTPSNWVFFIGPINAESDEEAIELSNELLPTVTGDPSPENDDDTWWCQYDTGSQDLGAIAIMADEAVTPYKMSRFLRKSH